MKDFFGDVKQHLLTGVSYILPIIIIYAFLLVIGQIPGEFGVMSAQLSSYAQMLIVPVLTAYIAYSIGNKLALAPAFTVGMMAQYMGLGFFGGLIAGLLIGYIVKGLIEISKKFKQGQANTILMSFIIVPLVTTIVGGLIFYFVIGAPLASGINGLNNWLSGLSTGNAIVLAMVLGAMIAFDMGGPVNKVAYTFAIGASTEGLHHVVAPVLVAITIPVLSLGLASILFKKKFDEDERIAGKTALFMSLFGLTEGAIPFAVVDPIRIIPSIMLGSVTGAAFAAWLGLTNTTVIPSLIGMILGSDQILLYLLAHIVGTLVSLVALYFLKRDVEEV